MAIVTEIKHQALERESRHTEVECTYDVIEADGKKFCPETHNFMGVPLLPKRTPILLVSTQGQDQAEAVAAKGASPCR